MSELTKKQKKHLRALAMKAYEIDLGRCIDTLFDKYQKWKQQQISVWEVNDQIHEYHDDIARSLYKTYTMKDPIYPVAFGVKSGAIDISEVDPSCLDEVERIVTCLDES